MVCLREIDFRPPPNMRILVTGGAGFIGANFLNLLVPRHPEHQFVNLDALTYAANLGSLDAVANRSNYTFERVDLCDFSALRAVFAQHKPDVVVHFAAESHVDRSITGPRAFVRTNVEGTFNLLEACRELWAPGQGLLHHVSTDEVFGSLAKPACSTKKPATIRRAPIPRPRRPAITWCTPGTAPSACRCG